jgi:hypothetical protein
LPKANVLIFTEIPKLLSFCRAQIVFYPYKGAKKMRISKQCNTLVGTTAKNAEYRQLGEKNLAGNTKDPSTCVIGCIFGKNFSAVYPAVNNYDAYFFCNNPEMKPVIEAAGWNYIFFDAPMSDDDAISSFESKYIKFLQFLRHERFEYFKKYDKIIYTDHKLELKDEHIKYLLDNLGDYSILIRNNGIADRRNIWEEFADAMRQERYYRFRRETIDYIREKMQEGYKDDPTVVWTALIVYKHSDSKTIDFVNKIYRDLAKVCTSECQIIWSMLGQKHEDIIKIINWDVPQIKWCSPSS